MGRTHGRLRERFKDTPYLGVWNQHRQVPKCDSIETLPVKLNTFDHHYNDGNDDTFLDLESSISLGTQEEMPETEDAEPDTVDSQSGGTISNVDEESESDVDD